LYKHPNCKLNYQQLHLTYLCNLARYWLQAPWGWHDSVETCRSVIICEIIVHLLFTVQNKTAHFSFTKRPIFFYLWISYSCLTTSPQPLPKPVLHTVRSSVSSSNFQYRLICLSSYSSKYLTSYSSSSRHFYPSFYLSFHNVLYMTVSLHVVTNPVSLFHVALNMRLITKILTESRFLCMNKLLMRRSSVMRSRMFW